MRLLRHGPAGHERPGILDRDGRIRDLSSILTDVNGDAISRAGLARLADIEIETLPLVERAVRLGVPIGGIGKFIAIGLNYADHAKEAGLPIPAEPIIFTKAISCLSGPNDPVMIPRGSQKTDWEVELGIVIGKRARYVPETRAMEHVAGYVVVNDVSERAYQKERGTQWDKGKGCDTFGPVGPYLVTADEIADPQSLDLWLDLNGKPMQRGNTRTMIFGVANLIAYVSEFITLEPGDILTTGTPPGVGEGQSPQRFLAPGDVMTLGIQHLGEQRQAAIAWRADPGETA